MIDLKTFLTFRKAFLFGFLSCVGLLAYALYLQHALWLDPCPLCILQRVAFVGMGVGFVIGALHNPGRRGRLWYAVFIDICGTAGAFLAGRHIWLQNLPADEVPDCGPGLGYMLDNFPLADAFRQVLEGSGECATVDWQFLGLSMPWWTLLWFFGLSALAIFAALRRS